MSKLGPKCQYFVWPPLFSSTVLILLGIKFTRASQFATGVLFHSSMTTSRSWWMLETLCSSIFRLRMPHRCDESHNTGERKWQIGPNWEIFTKGCTHFCDILYINCRPIYMCVCMCVFLVYLITHCIVWVKGNVCKPYLFF